MVEIENKQKIYQVFSTFQGEGAYILLPVILIRFAQCNLRCTFCDSYENWSNPGRYFTPSELINYISDNNNLYKSTFDNIYSIDKHILMFTGGEPLLTVSRQEFIVETSMLWYSKTGVDFVIIETNGTKDISPELFARAQPIKFHFSISPKEKRYQQNKEVSTYPILATRLSSESYPNITYSLKFVYESVESEDHILTISKENSKNSVGIFVMPEGTTKEKLLNNMYQTIRFCANNGFIFTPRWHILQGYKETFILQPDTNS